MAAPVLRQPAPPGVQSAQEGQPSPLVGSRAAVRTAGPVPARAGTAPARGSRAPRKGSGPAPAGSVPPPAPAGRTSYAGPPPIRLKTPGPQKDPRFNRVMEKLQQSAGKTAAHPPPARKAVQASAAAQPPANEKLAGAKANQVDTMQQAETGKPEPASFLELLRAEIARVMPTTLGETEDFMNGDQKQQMKGALTGNVNQQKDAASSGLKAASGEQPDPSKVPGKEVTPLPPQEAPVPPAIGAADAMPAPRPAEEISLQKSKDQAGQALADNKLTEQQLQKANDPRFSAVLAAKGSVEKQADAGPQKFRGEESKVLSQAAGGAVADEKKGLINLFGVRGRSNTAVLSRQQAAKAKEEAERKQVVADIEAIYNRTKETVDAKLASLEKDVSDRFDKGVEGAMNAMTSYIDGRMSDWKHERYKWPWGGARWLKDKLAGLPDEVNVFYEEGRKIFTRALDAVIVDIAGLVETRLKEAKDEVARGQKEIRTYVSNLPKNLKSVGLAAEKDMADRFAELRQGIEDKKNDLAQGLAQRYKEATDKANEKLKAMQEENKGLVQVLAEKIGEVIKILREFKEKVMGLLKKAAAVIDDIVADPIGFLKNLLAAIKQGISQFVTNIWTHLKAGFMKWLFGSLADAGITMPADFSLGSILKLVLQVLGITYDRIRAKAVKLIGERNVMIIEKAFELLKALWDGGPAALWEKVKEFLGDLKSMVLDAIQDWLISTIIKQATIKLVSMFNPVGAIIQAILMIYNTVMFLIENINRIIEFVESVINSVAKIVAGAIGDAANYIEQALGRTVPIIIGFLARLLGLSGLTDKIIGFIKKIQTKVDQAIDKVISKIVGGIKSLFGGGKGKAEDKDSGDVRGIARVLLQQRLRAGATQQAAQLAVADVLGQLRPKGLRSLELGKETPEGQIEVFAEASPRSSLFRLIREARGRTVRVAGRLTLVGQVIPEGGFKGVERGLISRGQGVSYQLLTPESSGHLSAMTFGGAILPVTGQTVEARTWNTGDIDRARELNSSHAEHYFVRFVSGQHDPAWQRRITHIEVDIHDYSPCTACADELVGLMNHLKGKRQPSDPSLTATLTWRKPYDKPPLATTQAALNTLAAAGWGVTPATVPPGEGEKFRPGS